MSKQELSQMREMSDQELKDEIKEAQSEIFNLKFQWMATRQLANPARLRSLRKKIARVKTIMRENKLGEVTSNA